jgi:hypothetical protein
VCGVVDSVQFSTFNTLSSSGIRIMIQVFVTAPLELEKKEIRHDINPKRPRHTYCRNEHWLEWSPGAGQWWVGQRRGVDQI